MEIQIDSNRLKALLEKKELERKEDAHDPHERLMRDNPGLTKEKIMQMEEAFGF
jgi:hypothetical protein